MTKADEASRKRIPNPLSKEQRAREAVEAMRDYEAAMKAELDKTARLKALRLARDAAVTADAKVAKKSSKRPAKKSAT